MGSDRPIGVYDWQPVSYHAHDPRASTVARRVASLIQSQLPTVSIEHIGSTSVPGCGGKGIVDLAVIYPEGQLEAARNTLDGLGFQRQTTRNPFPEDRPMRVGSIEHEGSVFRLHVHVLSASSSETEQLRAFRSELESDSVLMAEYMEQKRAILASGCTDPVDYSFRKGGFVAEVLSRREGHSAGTTR